MIYCPICSNSQIKLKFKLIHNVYQCKKCKTQFCPDASFDESFKSDLNEEERAKALRYIRKENFKKIISSLKKYISPNNKGLEVGSGYGWFLESCKEESIECEGIEPETRFNETYISNGLKVQNGFYPNVVKDSIKYDFIIFNDVMEHIPEINTITKSNYLLLNNNGLLIINIPIQEGLVYFISKISYRFGIKSLLNRMWQFNFHSPHIYYFTKRGITEYISSSHFNLIESYKLKTINISEIGNRLKQDKNQGLIKFCIYFLGTLILFPFFQIFPDTYCFIFRKVKI